jgi:hypothetical protein
MDWTLAVAMDAAYDPSDTQWKLTLLTEDDTPILFIVDFDHQHALEPRDVGWGNELLTVLGLTFTHDDEWVTGSTSRWRAAVRPIAGRDRDLQPSFA